MTVGIVGAEAAKFTTATELAAREHIHALLTQRDGITKVVSGKCHLGGIDIWAIEEAQALGIPTEEFPPRFQSWLHYKIRNEKIAKASDLVVCIAVRELPSTYTGMRFRECYHCHRTDHVKSGGCWTMKYAQSIGKQGELIIV